MEKRARKSEHWDLFSSRIQTMLDKKMLCDVLLISEKQRFPANRMLLSGCSEYFQSMFTGSFKEKDRDEIHIKGVRASDLSVLIEFCVTGTLEINPETAESLLCGANFLQFPIATSICCEYILEEISTSSCLSYWLLAKQLMLREFEKKIFRYCLDNFTDISDSIYVELNHDELEEIVGNPDLNIQAEKDVFNIIMTWIKHEPKTRMQNINHIVSCVDFNFVKQNEYSKYVELIRQYKEARDFFFELMNFYLSATNEEDLMSSSRKSTIVPISLSDVGFEFYQKKKANWEPCTGITEELLKYKRVLAAHVASNRLYIVSKRQGYKITIEAFDLRKNSPSSCIAVSTYDDAAVTFSFPMVYLIGTDKTFCGLNLITREEFSHTSMSDARFWPGVVYLDDILYVFGGTSAEWSYYSSTECFSFKSQTWAKSKCAKMLFAVCKMGIAAMNGKIYVLGGAIAGSSTFTPTNKIQCYDPIRLEWTLLGDFDTKCYDIQMSIWNGKLLASGRFESATKDVYAYDPELDAWEKMGSLQNISTYLCTASIDFFID